MSPDPMKLETNRITIVDFTYEGTQCPQTRL